MLEEERLVPTNCMRACTAVVTEMSYNHSDKPSALYRADIEFIQASEWEKDLRISLKELIDANGQVSRECNNPESEAGVAYAKIKAVYPSWTKDELARSSVEELMAEDCVRNVLGTTKNIEKSQADYFYRALQGYVDSKEKVCSHALSSSHSHRRLASSNLFPATSSYMISANIYSPPKIRARRRTRRRKARRSRWSSGP